MTKFISTKISNLERFDSEILEILQNFNAEILENSKFKDEILKLANNKFLCKISSVNTIKSAFEIYGKEEIFALFLFVIFRQKFSGGLNAYKITPENFTEISLMRNALMFFWLKNFTNADKILLSVTILIEFSRFFIDECIANLGKNGEFYREIKHCVFPHDFTDVERKFCGSDRESVAFALFKHFGLDKIAQYSLFAGLIDEADESIKKECAMIKIVKTAVNIYHRLDELSIDNTLNLLDEYIFEQDAFIEASKSVSL